MTPGPVLVGLDGGCPARDLAGVGVGERFRGLLLREQVKPLLGANGWEFWATEDPTGKTTLATYRARYLDSRQP